MSSIKRSSTRRSDDTMDDDSDDKDSKRKSRNLSEKKRRDQFNLLVNELNTMVSTGGRKMDKSTVLKSTISFLKNHNEITVRSRINEIQEDWKPTFLTNEEFTHLVLEAVDGFIMVFSTSGHIYYASESIASLLGHLPSDLLNTTIYELVSEEERSDLYNVLLTPSDDEKQVSFSCHFRRSGPAEKNRHPTYELVSFVGYFRTDEDMVQGENRYSGYSGEADTRLVFVGTGRLQTPQLLKELPLVETVKSEFTSRHSLEWKFLYLDHRAPPIIGYLPFELLGTSGYDYYHIDDLEKVVKCHEALMQKGEGTSCYYRFLTKGQQWIWLQTRYYITYHQWNSKPEFIVCTHRVVSYSDVLKQYREGSNSESLSTAFGEQSPAMSVKTTGGGGLSWLSSSGGDAKSRGTIRPGSASDCTSVSCDSPGSKYSSSIHRPAHKRSTSYQGHQTHHSQQQSLTGKTIPVNQHQSTAPSPDQQAVPLSPQQQHMMTAQVQPQAMSPQAFVEPPPPQYVAAIPLQSATIVPNFATAPPAAVLSPLPEVDNMVMSSAQSQLQVDLQRKHAQLQAIIDQQQQELRRVSEQLLMARLGLLPGSQAQAVVQNVPMQYHQSVTTSVTGAPSCTVSSTSAAGSAPTDEMLHGVPGGGQVIVPVSGSLQPPVGGPAPQPSVSGHTQITATIIYSQPDSNTQGK
ncbi:unnamed protein product [Acanthoscelides obtectus]|uniref:Clock n=1 Tax=Acanthoscelides obtectus TaxID=200917 RepID=A0A9P0L9H3_ACAOB|nr:unnamed protein product [Acanthoscelides obtectus]CAK1638857.1 Circadian locomoter output cycles protein kaput [Acanthoscelides obtectus]